MPEEQRFALVLNGGVSLAVWMSGVVHEINALRVLSSGGGQAAAQTPSRQAWREILDGAHTSVVVDLVAGTSAGGLNGALLAHAIATGRDLTGLRELWLDSASLTPPTLLNDPPSESSWALDAGFFGCMVADALEEEETPIKPARITLLTTATAVDSKPRELSASGRYYQATDSRRVYRFRHRVDEQPVSDFSNTEPLKRAAQASASYPFAFAPVEETPQLAKLRVDDRRNYDDRWRPGLPSLLIDGGVLDNAPFEPLLDELVKTPISGDWTRHLIYINPAVDTQGSAMNIDVQGEFARLLPLIREPDQRLDEDALDTALQASKLEQSRPHTVLGDWLSRSVELPAVDDCLLEHYQKSRRETALIQLGRPGESVPREFFSVVVPASREPEEATWSWGLAAAVRLTNWWGRVIGLAKGDRTEAYDEVGRVQEWLDYQRCMLDDDLRAAPTGAALDAFKAFYSDALRNKIATRMTAAAQAVAELFGKHASDLMERSLRLEMLSATFSWSAKPIDLPKIKYTRLTPGAPAPFEDPAFAGGVDGTKKLYGQRWNHFGAFATRRGRERDWLWGRLDAATTLTQLLRPDDLTARATLVDAILTEELVGMPDSQLHDTLVGYYNDALNKQPTELFKDMEADSQGVWDDLRATAFGLAKSTTRLRAAQPFIAAVLGQEADASSLSTTKKALVKAIRLFAPDEAAHRWLRGDPQPSLQQRAANAGRSFLDRLTKGWPSTSLL